MSEYERPTYDLDEYAIFRASINIPVSPRAQFEQYLADVLPQGGRLTLVQWARIWNRFCDEYEQERSEQCTPQ